MNCSVLCAVTILNIERGDILKKRLMSQIFIVDIILAVAAICLYAEPLIGLSFTSSDTMVMAYVMLALILMVFIAVNIRLITTRYEEDEIIIDEIEDVEFLKDELKKLQKIKPNFGQEIHVSLEQMDRMSRKYDMLYQLLYQSFHHNEDMLNTKECMNEMQEMLYDNIKQIIKCLKVLDAKEYVSLRADYRTIDNDVMAKKQQQLQENVNYIREKVNKNEQILLAFDHLMTEISRIHDSEEENDLSKINDMVSALRKLRTASSEDPIEELIGKYQ